MAHKYVAKLAELKVKVHSYHILVCHHVGTTLLVKMSTQESSFNKYWIWTFKKALIASSALDENNSSSLQSSVIKLHPKYSSHKCILFRTTL